MAGFTCVAAGITVLGALVQLLFRGALAFGILYWVAAREQEWNSLTGYRRSTSLYSTPMFVKRLSRACVELSGEGRTLLWGLTCKVRPSNSPQRAKHNIRLTVRHGLRLPAKTFRILATRLICAKLLIISIHGKFHSRKCDNTVATIGSAYKLAISIVRSRRLLQRELMPATRT